MGGGSGEGVPAVGFGFGDAVIVELLKDRGLLPQLLRDDVDVMVYAMDAGLRGQAAQLATTLRQNEVDETWHLPHSKFTLGNAGGSGPGARRPKAQVGFPAGRQVGH